MVYGKYLCGLGGGAGWLASDDSGEAAEGRGLAADLEGAITTAGMSLAGAGLAAARGAGAEAPMLRSPRSESWARARPPPIMANKMRRDARCDQVRKRIVFCPITSIKQRNRFARVSECRPLRAELANPRHGSEPRKPPPPHPREVPARP